MQAVNAVREYFRKRKRPMPVSEKLLASPWKKWRVYGRFPTKLFLHVMLVFFTTLQLLGFTGEEAFYRSNSMMLWKEKFLYMTGNEDTVRETVPTIQFTSVADIREHMTAVVDNYYALPKTSPDTYVLGSSLDAKESDSPVTATVRHYSPKGGIYNGYHHASVTTTVRNLKESTPLSEIDQFVNKDLSNSKTPDLVDVIFNVNLSNTQILSDIALTYYWDVNVVYDFSKGGGTVLVHIESSSHMLKGLPLSSILASPDLYLDITVGILSAWALLLSFRAIRSSTRVFKRAKQILSSPSNMRDGLGWQSLSTTQKLRFYNKWFLISLVGNILNLSGAFADIMFHANALSPTLARYVIVLGCALAWANMTRYLEYDRRYYSLVLALRHGFPSVARFVIGACPIFFAYGILGYSIFGAYSDRFSTITTSLFTLFSLMNGDVILETYDGIVEAGIFITNIYLYSFLVVFIYLVVSLFIGIFSDAYAEAQKLVDDDDSQGDNTQKELVWSRVLQAIAEASDENSSDADEGILQAPFMIHQQAQACSGGDSVVGTPYTAMGPQPGSFPPSTSFPSTTSGGNPQGNPQQLYSAAAASVAPGSGVAEKLRAMQVAFLERRRAEEDAFMAEVAAVVAGGSGQAASPPSMDPNTSFLGRAVGISAAAPSPQMTAVSMHTFPQGGFIPSPANNSVNGSSPSPGDGEVAPLLQ